MEAGLIFVQTKDSLGQIVCSITKEQYNHIGFYLDTMMTGFLSTKIFLFDVFRSDIARWLPANCTLEHLCVHPIVSKVSKKKFKGTENMETLENFKLAIASALSTHKEYPIIPSLYKLFGHKCDPICIENKTDEWCSLSSTDLINNTFENLSIIDKFVPVNTIIDNKIIDPVAQITAIFTRLPNNELTISSFLSDTTYFDKVTDIDLIPFQDSVNKDGLLKYNIENSYKLSELFTTFNQHLNLNSEFKETIIKSIEFTKKHKSKGLKESLSRLETILESNTENTKLIDTIKDAVKKIYF